MLPTTTTTHGKEIANVSSGSWGSEGTSSKDLVIPKIQLAQASSNICKEGNAKPGELIHSLTKEVLLSKGQKLQILPILSIGSWVVTTPKPAGGGYPDFIRNEPLTEINDSDNWKIESFEDNRPVVFNKRLTFLVLLVSRTDAFPFFMDFQATNKNGGKILSTVIQENKFQNLPAPARVVELSTSLKSFKGNSWFVIGVAPMRKATEAELAACKKWYDLFSKVNFKTEEEEEDNGIA
jgi:hypothetical protein